MKKTFPLLLTSRGAIATITAFAFFIALQACNQPAPKQIAAVDASAANAQASVPATEVLHALLQARARSLPIYVCIIKENADTTDAAMRLLFLYDSAQTTLSLNGGYDAKNFAQQSTWYVSYLKTNGVAAGNVVLGYQLNLTSAELTGVDSIHAMMFPFAPKKNHVYLKSNTARQPWKYDDSCKVPPGCALLSQSAEQQVEAMQKQYGQ